MKLNLKEKYLKYCCLGTIIEPLANQWWKNTQQMCCWDVDWKPRKPKSHNIPKAIMNILTFWKTRGPARERHREILYHSFIWLTYSDNLKLPDVCFGARDWSQDLVHVWHRCSTTRLHSQLLFYFWKLASRQ